MFNRTHWLLTIQVIGVAIFLSACGESSKPPVPEILPSDSKPELKSPSSLPPRQPWASKPALKIYYDSEPLPLELLATWKPLAPPEIVQIKLTPNASGEFPQDGDLYLVTPPTIKKLRSLLDWQVPSKLVPQEQINPLFTSHPFDKTYAISLPWRWSPYVFYRKKESLEKKLPPLSFSDWSSYPQGIWPQDWALLWAMSRHLSKGSANAMVEDSEIKLFQETKNYLAPKTLSEEECWRTFSEGKTPITFARAAWHLKTTVAQDSLIEWAIPSQGTLIHLDHFLIPSQSSYLNSVNELVSYLVSSVGQKEMTKLTGFFPVRSRRGQELAASTIPLPKTNWLDNSEFLVLDLEALLVPAAAASVIPKATPTPSLAPMPTSSPSPSPSSTPVSNPTPTASPSSSPSPTPSSLP